MLRHKSFKHGWFYHYRTHDEKASTLCTHGLEALHEYLNMIHKEGCPDEKFTTGPRGSSLRQRVNADIKEARGHELCQYAAAAPRDRYSTAHSNVQVHVLENDSTSIAVEVPLWLDAHEDELMHSFEEAGALTGHIDLLRVEDGKVWVWDYKPRAAKEKYAAAQVYAYAVMLSKRTRLPLERFRCGWFDEETAYVFNPARACFKEFTG